jgi:hypothetical protein
LRPAAISRQQRIGLVQVQVDLGPHEKAFQLDVLDVRVLRVETLGRTLQLVFVLEVAIGRASGVCSLTPSQSLPRR